MAERFAPAEATENPAGSFLHVPAGAVHADGAEEEAVPLGTAVRALVHE